MDAPPKKMRRSTESPSSEASVSPQQVPFQLILDETISARDIENSPHAADSPDRDPLSSLHEGNSDKNNSTQKVSRKKKAPKDSAKLTTKKNEKKLPNNSKKKLILNDTGRLMVHNVYKYVCKIQYEEDKRDALEFEEVKVKVNACVLKTAEILGISRTTVYRVLKEHKESEEIIVC